MTLCNLIIVTGSYQNDDALENVINYIGRLENSYSFSFAAWPPTKENTCQVFQQTRQEYPQNTIDKQLHHIIFTFQTCKDASVINLFSYQIASYFAQRYPVYFALHNDKKHYHTHMAISTTSYLPDCPPLTNQHFNEQINTLKQIALQYGVQIKEVLFNHVREF